MKWEVNGESPLAHEKIQISHSVHSATFEAESTSTIHHSEWFHQDHSTSKNDNFSGDIGWLFFAELAVDHGFKQSDSKFGNWD
jgi:hypothetical protein